MAFMAFMADDLERCGHHCLHICYKNSESDGCGHKPIAAPFLDVSVNIMNPSNGSRALKQTWNNVSLSERDKASSTNSTLTTPSAMSSTSIVWCGRGGELEYTQRKVKNGKLSSKENHGPEDMGRSKKRGGVQCWIFSGGAGGSKNLTE